MPGAESRPLDGLYDSHLRIDRIESFPTSNDAIQRRSRVESLTEEVQGDNQLAIDSVSTLSQGISGVKFEKLAFLRGGEDNNCSSDKVFRINSQN